MPMTTLRGYFCAITSSHLTKLGFCCLGLGLFVPAQASETKRFPITMQLDWIYNVQFAGLYQAIEQGYYEEAGLEVTLRPVTFGQDTVGRVVETRHCIGSAESNVLLKAQVEGAPVRALSTMFQGSPMGWMYMQDSGVTGIEDFSTRRIGIHPDGDKVVRLALAYHGIDGANIETMKVGYNVDILISGEVELMQGYWIDEFVKLQLMSNDGGGFIRAKDHGYEAYSQVFFSTEDFCQRHPEEIAAFLEASRQGWAYALSNIEETAMLVVEKYNAELSLEHQVRSLEVIREMVMPDGQTIMAPMSRSVWEEGQNRFLANGILESPADLDALLKFADLE